MDYQTATKLARLLTIALECSYYVSPDDPGLTHSELVEIGDRLGIKAGQVNDCFQMLNPRRLDNQRLGPDPSRVHGWVALNLAESPEFISDAAGDYWAKALNDAADEVGAAQARIDKESTIARAEGAGISRKDMAAFLAVEVAMGRVVLNGGVVSLPRGHTVWVGRSEQRRQLPGARRTGEDRQRVHDLVRDMIGRRTDGRAAYADPLKAFAERLAPLGYGHFSLWWTQLREECERADPQIVPVSVLVLSAALVEGCLTFVAKYARGTGSGLFGSRTFDEAPTNWKLEHLINGAAAGSSPILDPTTKLRAETLGKTRQRIHAGRMLSDFPNHIPDLRVEEAREARDTAKRVVRLVLDWLDKQSSSPVGL